MEMRLGWVKMELVGGKYRKFSQLEFSWSFGERNERNVFKITEI